MELLKSENVRGMDGQFDVLATTPKSQIASMTLEPEQTSGEYGSEHPNSDQILIVLRGEAIVKVEGEDHHLLEGDVLLIEAGEQHQIVATGLEPLRTLSVYSPPGY